MMNITEETNQNISNNTNNIFNTIQWNQGPPHYAPWGHTPNSPPAPLVTFNAPVQMEQNIINNVNNQVIGSTNNFGHNISTSNYGAKPLLHCKRKANIEFSIPNKQHITEEKMAQHMSRLHISSETHLDQISSEIEDNTTRQKRLYVCEEMRRLQTENILPTALLGRLERPCMAVMLWQPPAKIPELICQPETSTAISNAMVQAAQASSQNNQIFQQHQHQHQHQHEDENDNSSGTVNLNNMEMDS